MIFFVLLYLSSFTSFIYEFNQSQGTKIYGKVAISSVLDESGKEEGGNYKPWDNSLAVEDVGNVSRITRIYAYSR